MNRHIIGVFSTEKAAIGVVEALYELGYSQEDISIISRNREDAQAIALETGTKAPEGIVTGAAAGGVLGGVTGLVGGLTGLLTGFGALFIPGIGPLIAAGPIMAALTGAAVGVGAGSLVGGLIGLGIPEKESEFYNTFVQEDKILVIVDAAEADRNHILAVYQTYGSLHANLEAEPVHAASSFVPAGVAHQAHQEPESEMKVYLGAQHDDNHVPVKRQEIDIDRQH